MVVTTILKERVLASLLYYKKMSMKKLSIMTLACSVFWMKLMKYLNMLSRSFIRISPLIMLYSFMR